MCTHYDLLCQIILNTQKPFTLKIKYAWISTNNVPILSQITRHFLDFMSTNAWTKSRDLARDQFVFNLIYMNIFWNTCTIIACFYLQLVVLLM